MLAALEGVVVALRGRLREAAGPVAVRGGSASDRAALVEGLLARHRADFPGGVWWLEGGEEGERRLQLHRALCGLRPETPTLSEEGEEALLEAVCEALRGARVGQRKLWVAEGSWRGWPAGVEGLRVLGLVEEAAPGWASVEAPGWEVEASWWEALSEEERGLAQALSHLGCGSLPRGLVKALGAPSGAPRRLREVGFLRGVVNERFIGRVDGALAGALRGSERAVEGRRRAREGLLRCLPEEPPEGLEGRALALGCVAHALAWWRLSSGEQEARDALVALRVGELYGAEGLWVCARGLLEEVLSQTRVALGEEHPDALTAMNHLSRALRGLGEHEGARALREALWEARRRVLGEEHEDTLVSMNNLAVTLGDLGDEEGALALEEEGLSRWRRALGEEHPRTLVCMDNLAHSLSGLGRLEEARALEEEALSLRRRVLGDAHPETLLNLSNLSWTLGRLGRLREARARGAEALGGQRRALPPWHVETLSSLHNLGEIVAAQRFHVEAEELLAEALAGRERVFGARSYPTLQTLSALLRLKLRMEEEEEARALLSRMEASLPAEVSEVGWIARFQREAREYKARLSSG